MQDHNEAFNNLMRAESVATEIGAKHLLTKCYKTLTDLYQEKHNYKKALETFALYTTLKDSIFNESKNKQMLEIQARYETEKKEKEIEILNKENTIKNLKLERSRYIRIFLIVTIIFILVVVIVLHNRYRLKSKANKLLQEKNKLDLN